MREIREKNKNIKKKVKKNKKIKKKERSKNIKIQILKVIIKNI
jgi:hypothetical protein